jgi:hypothetical protein
MRAEIACPDFPEVQQALRYLLTPQLSKLLRNARPEELLMTLNQNTTNPTRIWTLDMRDELLAFIDKVLVVDSRSLSQKVCAWMGGVCDVCLNFLCLSHFYKLNVYTSTSFSRRQRLKQNKTKIRASFHLTSTCTPTSTCTSTSLGASRARPR